eukprot:TRINITY_DN471_c0_g1_i1.p1 TRINITY_DN471_c0_g1~~TRINITY_DN471_c0_g1_i1.p1  ORF type:complete len:176 (-),score=41.22 TRINITY_DN471_c0_g1_i1:84-611(-)
MPSRLNRSREVVDEFSDYIAENKLTNERRFLYITNGFVLSLVPVYLYYAVFGMSMKSYAIVYLVMTALSSFGLQFAYNNVACSVNNKMTRERQGGGIGRARVAGKDVVAAQKVMQKKATVQESVAFSILYNNSIFLFSLILLAFYFFPSLPSVYNYALSVGLSAGIVALLSQPRQ